MRSDLVLRDSKGNLVKDTEWNELIFDIRTAEKRNRIMAIVEPWIKECATKGF